MSRYFPSLAIIAMTFVISPHAWADALLDDKSHSAHETNQGSNLKKEKENNVENKIEDVDGSAEDIIRAGLSPES